jgi:hypothetical protein
MKHQEPEIRHFLVVYDVVRELAKVEDFGEDYEAALKAYGEREQDHRFDPAYEVVLLGADSLDTIKKTHSSYFVQPEEHAFARYIRRSAAVN